MQFTEHIDKFLEKTKSNLFSHGTAEPGTLLHHDFIRKLAHALYQPYKWLIFIPFFVLSTLFLFPFAVITVLIFGPKTCSAVFPPIWAKINSFMTPMSVTISGSEWIDPDQSYVVVSNHQSFYDIFVLYGWLELDIKWVMKKELRKVPIIGYICYKMEHIFIDRSNRNAAIESINRAKRNMTNGTSVIFFPEGTRSMDGNLGRFKKGAFRLAADLGLPILPVTISGTHEILPKKTVDLFPGSATMTIHPPIRVLPADRGNLGPLMQRTRAVISSAIPDNRN